MPLLWLSLAYLAGLVLGDGAALAALHPAWPWLAAFLVLACLLAQRLAARWHGPPWWILLIARAASRDARLHLPPLLLAAAFALGAWQVSAAQQPARPGEIAALNDQGLFRLVGVVSAPPERREESTLARLNIESAAAVAEDWSPGPSQPTRGALLVMMPGPVDWQYGDRVMLEGRPVTPPANEEFSYRDALARQGIYSYLAYPRAKHLASGAGSPLLGAIYHLRELAYAKIYDLFPAPEAPLLAGILLGIESDLTPAWQRAFRDTGTAHIIAISGFNIALLAGMFSELFRRLFSRWWAAGLAALAIGLYTLLVGAQPSVVRAALMGSLGLLGALLGRRSTGLAGLNTLAFTGALMCLANPLLPRDASFQLSFAATLGLMLYAGPLQDGFQRLAAARLGLPLARRLAGPVGEYILFTLAAQAVTLPVIAYHFERLSLSALLANPLVLPAQPLLMILSGLAVIAGLLFDPLGHLLAGLAWPFSAYTLRVVEWLAGFPGGSTGLGLVNGPTAALLAILALCPFLYSLAPASLKTSFRAQARPATFLAASALLALLALRGAATRADGRLHLTLLNQDGQAVALMQTPGGTRVLIGSASGSNRLSAALGRRLPLDHRLHGLLLTHCTTSVIESLPAVLARFPLEQVWWGCLPPEDRAGRALTTRLAEQSIPSQILDRSRVLQIEGTTLRLLAIAPESAAAWLAWQNLRVLLPGGLTPGGLGASAQLPGLLLLDKEDLDLAAPQEWEALSAQVVIVAANAGPHGDLPARWVVLPPDGWAEIVSDGEQLWVEVGR